MAGLVQRIWDRLREAYEAQLVEDAVVENPRAHPPRVPLSIIGVERARVMGALVPGTVRSPRTLGALGWLLRPKVLQFGLPMALLATGARIYRMVHTGTDFWPGGLVGLGFTFLLSLAFNSWVGGWIFSSRWERLRHEAYERWKWREVAEVEVLEAAMREPRRLADDATPQSGPP